MEETLPFHTQVILQLVVVPVMARNNPPGLHLACFKHMYVQGSKWWEFHAWSGEDNS